MLFLTYFFYQVYIREYHSLSDEINFHDDTFISQSVSIETAEQRHENHVYLIAPPFDKQAMLLWMRHRISKPIRSNEGVNHHLL